MTTLTSSLGIQIKDGPQVSIPPIKTEVEAYDKIAISIEPGKDVTVDVQPGNKSVVFLLITSSLYTHPDAQDTEKLTYTPDEKEPINLENPQFFLGLDAIEKLLGAVKKITFSNKLASLPGESTPPKVDISILVARDATPDPSEP
jgi:hypothetical protein